MSETRSCRQLITTVAIMSLAGAVGADAGVVSLSVMDTTPWDAIVQGDVVRVRADVDMTDYSSTPILAFDAVLASTGDAWMTFVGGTPDGDSPLYVPSNDAFRDTTGGPYDIDSSGDYALNRAKGLGEVSTKTVQPSLHPLKYGPMGQYLDGDDGLWEWDIRLSADMPAGDYAFSLSSVNAYAYSITSTPLEGVTATPIDFTVYYAGDIDLDGFVGLSDLDIILTHWNEDAGVGNPQIGDLTGDGFVGIDDLDVVLGNWNVGTPPSVEAVVPEPGSFVLLVCGLFGSCSYAGRAGRRP